MPFYPSFAFFAEQASLSALAAPLAGRLGRRLPRIRFECVRYDGPGPERLDFDSAEQALEHVTTHDSRLHRIWMAGELGSLTFWCTKGGALAVDLWDTSPGPGDTLAADRRRLALALHRVLVRYCGALLSFTSSHEDSYAGDPGHYDHGIRFERALPRGEAEVRALFGESPPYFWIVATRQDTCGLGPEDGRGFGLVTEDEQHRILENEEQRPIFLSPPGGSGATARPGAL